MLKLIGLGLGALFVYVGYKLATADGTQSVAPSEDTKAPPAKTPAKPGVIGHTG